MGLEVKKEERRTISLIILVDANRSDGSKEEAHLSSLLFTLQPKRSRAQAKVSSHSFCSSSRPSQPRSIEGTETRRLRLSLALVGVKEVAGDEGRERGWRREVGGRRRVADGDR